MNRFVGYIGLLTLSFPLLAAPSFSNVVFHVTTLVDNGHGLDTVTPGDIVTLNIRLTNDSPADFIAGVGGSVTGYDPSTVQFVDGQSADTNLFCTNAPCNNGLVSRFDGSTPLFEQSSPISGSYVPFVDAITIAPKNGDGTRDPGIDGLVGGGDVEFRVRFRYLGGLARFNIGTTENDAFIGNAIVTTTTQSPDTWVVSVKHSVTTVIFPVPEPGVALLVGLGLAALAAGRRE